jgi:hypothetical protein
MPKSLTTELASRQQREELHRTLDIILDGMDGGDPDDSVRGVLTAIGWILRIAAPALDYETGRVLCGIDRPLGTYPRNTAWEGAACHT